MVGEITVSVFYSQQVQQLNLLVVRGGRGPTLLGRDWLKHLKLDWNQLLHRVHVVDSPSSKLEPSNPKLRQVLERHSAEFRDELGTITELTAVIHVKADAQPVFCRARPVPYALRKKVAQELERLQSEGVIQPVKHSDWASPIVPVVKRDGSIRICGDFKTTVNQVANRDIYLFPRAEDLFNQLSGGQAFSKLDLSHAYQQMQPTPIWGIRRSSYFSTHDGNSALRNGPCVRLQR